MKIYRPRQELLRYVRYYWVLESDAAFRTLTFPTGCPQIIFHLKSPLFIPELNSWQYRLTVSGQVNFPAHIESAGGLEMIVAVFYPHTAGMFLGVPPSAFYNLEISGYDLGNRVLSDVASMVFDCGSHERAIAIIEEWLCRCLAGADGLDRTDRIGHSVGCLMRGSAETVGSLAEAACLGRRQFERLFRQQVGMSPKEYSRVVRFQRSLSMMQGGCRDYMGIAADCGYSDQSHFIRDFKAMSGHTPRSLVGYCEPYSDLFTNSV